MQAGEWTRSERAPLIGSCIHIATLSGYVHCCFTWQHIYWLLNHIIINWTSYVKNYSYISTFYFSSEKM